MELKTYVWIGIILGGLIGGVGGSMLDHGNIFGLWGILISGLGSIIGIFIGYKLYSS
jgi:hypothetical protein